MFIISKRLSIFYAFLLCHSFRIPPSVDGRIISIINESEIENKLLAASILEKSFNDSITEEELTEVNCTFLGNGTNSTCNYVTVYNDTGRNGTRVRKRDQFKFLIIAVLIPILIKIAFVIIKILKVILSVIRLIGRLTYYAARIVGRFAFKAMKFAMQQSKILSRYVIKAGKLIWKIADEGYEIADLSYSIATPIMDYYQQQEEARLMAQADEELRQQDLLNNRQAWKDADGYEGPQEVGMGDPEWQPQRKPSLLLGGGDESEQMPSWIVATIVIVLVLLIVALPTGAYIVTHRKEIRSRVCRKRTRGKELKSKSKAKSKMEKSGTKKSKSKANRKSLSKSKSKKSTMSKKKSRK